VVEHLAHESGTRIEAAVGDRIVVELPENASTGYQWSVVELPEHLELQRDRLGTPRRRAPGAATTHEYLLGALAPGSGRVVLELARAWETTAPERRFTVEVTVR
jgi:inhibitor of cysteine peptidase